MFTYFFPPHYCPGHLPVHPDSTDPNCLVWNFDQLLTIIRSHSSVVCYMSGHDHEGGYHLDQETGVHHVTLEGVIETPPDSNAFGTVAVYDDRMVLKGNGRIPDRVLLFPRRQNDPDRTAEWPSVTKLFLELRWSLRHIFEVSNKDFVAHCMKTEYLLIVFLFVCSFVGYCRKTAVQYVRQQRGSPFFCTDKRESGREETKGQQFFRSLYQKFTTVQDPPRILQTDEIPTSIVLYWMLFAHWRRKRLLSLNNQVWVFKKSRYKRLCWKHFKKIYQCASSNKDSTS